MTLWSNLYVIHFQSNLVHHYKSKTSFTASKMPVYCLFDEQTTICLCFSVQCYFFLLLFFEWHSQLTVTSFHFRSADGKQKMKKKWIVAQSKANKLTHGRCPCFSIKTWGGGQKSHAGSPATLLTPWLTRPSPHSLWCHTTHTHTRGGLEWQRYMRSSWGLFTGNTQENLKSLITHHLVRMTWLTVTQAWCLLLH